MTIQYASDLHFEFPENSKFLAENPIQPVGEILVLCGDIDCMGQKGYPEHPFWDWASAHYEQVLVVPGNHEFYKGFDLKQMEEDYFIPIRHNVKLCHNHTIRINETEFILTTLWSRIRPEAAQTIERFINDYRLIRYDGKKLNTKISNQLHFNSLYYLEQAFKMPKQGKRIVVTHHVPTFSGLAAEFEGSILNDAFVTDLADLIVESHADAWIYGHSHRNCQPFQIGNTMLLTNQLGYVSQCENISFKSSCIITI